MASNDTGGQERAARRSDEAVEADEAAPVEQAQSDVRERHEKLGDDVDALLDEIDGVLEENAEEFVRGYVQKGGE